MKLRRCHVSLPCAAFSLIEMVLALGVFAFCIVVIIGLLSSLLGSSRESWMETRSAQIARQIMEDLTPDPAGDTNSITQATATSGILNKLPTPEQVPLFSANPYSNSAYYTAEGIPVLPADAFFKADLLIQPVTMETATGALPAREISQVRIDVRPAAAQTNAPSYRFFSRISPRSLP